MYHGKSMMKKKVSRKYDGADVEETSNASRLNPGGTKPATAKGGKSGSGHQRH